MADFINCIKNTYKSVKMSKSHKQITKEEDTNSFLNKKKNYSEILNFIYQMRKKFV